MSKYSEKKERQIRQSAKETVARAEDQEDPRGDPMGEYVSTVADKVRLKNRLVEILALFTDAESSLSKAYSALGNIRLQSSGIMSVFLKELDYNNLFAMEKTNSAIAKTNNLITILVNQM